MAFDAGGNVHSTPVHVAILAEDDVPEMDTTLKETRDSMTSSKWVNEFCRA